MRYDAVVVGLGAMGSAAVYQLAKAGARVLGIDRYRPPHRLGSTHGDTRITRVAIGEGLEYVPLVQRSHEIWRDVESQTGADLLTQCGGLVMGAEDSQSMHGSDTFLEQTVSAARTFGIDHRLLDPGQLKGRFPQFELTGSEVGYEEPGAGFVRPERCVEAQLTLASELGATLRFGEQVLSYDDDGAKVTLRTPTGTVTAPRLVVTAGPWVTQLLPDLAGRLTVYRQVLYWFDLEDRSQYPAYRKLPVFIWWGGRARDDVIYGFPMVDGPDGGVKVAREQYETATTVEAVNREVSQAEIDEMYDEHVRDRLPGLSRRCVKAVTCLYTVTSDSRFILDVHPANPNVIVASPCSGHGFKHSAAIGECLAQLATQGRSDIDISSFAYPTIRELHPDHP
jgi:sarcosine oxidase